MLERERETLLQESTVFRRGTDSDGLIFATEMEESQELLPNPFFPPTASVLVATFILFFLRIFISPFPSAGRFPSISILILVSEAPAAAAE